MTKTIRLLLLAAAAASLASAAAFSQSAGKAIFEARCVECHGATGLANSGAGKLMRVKPVTDASVRKMSQPEMVRWVSDGAGRMEAYKGSLTNQQIRAAVEYFRSFIGK